MTLVIGGNATQSQDFDFSFIPGVGFLGTKPFSVNNFTLHAMM